jgi:hypothetical protein
MCVTEPRGSTVAGNLGGARRARVWSLDETSTRKRIKWIVGLALLIGVFAGPAVTHAFTPPPGYRGCGSFQARYTIHVLAKHVSCRKARQIQREYWLAPESEKELVGPDEYNGYIRLKRFPGWRCTSGAMAGDCVKGSKEAGYSTYNG